MVSLKLYLLNNKIEQSRLVCLLDDGNEGHLSKRCMGRHGDFIRIISPLTQLSDTYTVYRGVSHISSF
jgi:hypothetical protein